MDRKTFLIFFGVSVFLLVMSVGSASVNAQGEILYETRCEEPTQVSGNRTYQIKRKFLCPNCAALPPLSSWAKFVLGLKKITPFVSAGLEDKYSLRVQKSLKGRFGKEAPISEKARIEKVLKEAENSVRPERRDAANRSNFDWRKETFDRGDGEKVFLDFGEVGDQGDCQVCWAFATVDAMRISRQLATLRNTANFKLNDDLSPSVRQLVSCTVPNRKDFCKINWHGDTLNHIIQNRGLPLGGEDEFEPDKEYRSRWTCNAEAYVRPKAWDYVHSEPNAIAPTEEIKKALVTYGPIMTTMIHDSSLWNYCGGVFNEEQKKGPLHVVLIVGWDDNKTFNGKDVGGAWLIKNSYGIEWGEGGYAWMKYESNNIGQWSAWVLADPKEEAKISKEVD